jgi:hypothetical protein
LILIGSALMMSVDSAMGTEEVLRRSGVEAVTCQNVLALKKCDPAHLCRDGDRTAHSTIRTGTAADSVEGVAQRRFKPDGTAMALAGPYIRVVCHGGLGSCRELNLSLQTEREQGHIGSLDWVGEQVPHGEPLSRRRRS